MPAIFGLSAAKAMTAAAIAVGICGAVVVVARPLLFASIDEAVAAARGVPVRLLGFGILAAATLVFAVAVVISPRRAVQG